MIIRDASEDDIPAITAIYNEVVLNSTAIYRDEPTTVAERAGLWRSRREQNYPTLVACDGDSVIGFSSFGDFRTSPGYRYSVEHTVHVHDLWRGRGVGSALVKALLPRA